MKYPYNYFDQYYNLIINNKIKIVKKLKLITKIKIKIKIKIPKNY
jgi:hypothetical protein